MVSIGRVKPDAVPAAIENGCDGSGGVAIGVVHASQPSFPCGATGYHVRFLSETFFDCNSEWRLPAVNGEAGYLDLLRRVWQHGVVRSDRTGTGTRALFGETLRGDGFKIAKYIQI